MKAILDGALRRLHGAAARCTSIPFSMGPLGSPIAQLGVEITDSPYVVVNMKIMTRMGVPLLEVLGTDGEFVPCMHTRRRAARAGRAGCAVAVQPRREVHRALPRGALDLVATAPATAATRCSARSASRCASPRRMARDEGWLAEHMLILGVDRPAGREDVRRGGVPERVRQDELRHAHPAAGVRRRGLEGDDRRRRHRLDQARRRRQALRDQPRGRLLRRRAGHVVRDEPERDGVDPRRTRSSPTSRSPTTATCGGRAWTATPPAHAIDWQGNDWTPDVGHARRRTRTRASPRPRRRTRRSTRTWDDPQGVPIRAFIFGGRRARHDPARRPELQLGVRRVHGARRWARRRPPPRSGSTGVVRRDPFAMLPFCGYHMGDYFNHWLQFGRNMPQPAAHLPGELVPHATRTASSSGRASARTCAS